MRSTGPELFKQCFQPLGGRGVRVDHFLCALKGFGDAGLVKGLEDVVHGVHFERANRIVVERRGENDLRYPQLALDKLLDYAKTVQARHLHLEENKVGVVVLDERNRLESVLALGDQIDLRKSLEEVGELVPGGTFVID